MRRLFLTLAATLALATPAMAEDGEASRWLHVPLTDGAIGWDVGTAVYEDDTDAWDVVRFMYYDAPQTIGDVTFRWRFEKLRIDCDANTAVLLEGEVYGDQWEMLGALTPEGNIVPIAEQTLDWILKVSLCDGADILEQREGAVLEDVMTVIETERQ